MLATITSAEYTELMAVADRLPLPERRADLRSAMQGLVFARSQGNDRVKFHQLLADYWAEADAAESQSPDEIDAVFGRIAARFEAREPAKV